VRHLLGRPSVRNSTYHCSVASTVKNTDEWILHPHCAFILCTSCKGRKNSGNWWNACESVRISFSSMPLQPLLGPGLPQKTPPSILLCLLVVSFILVFLGSVMCPSGRRPHILFLVFSLVLYYEISHKEFVLGLVVQFWTVFGRSMCQK
jgi:hypothetical protein